MLYSILLTSHSILRYLLLLLLIWAVIKSFWGWQKRMRFDGLTERLSFFTVIAAHLQLLTGFVLYWISPLLNYGRNHAQGWMSDHFLRYWMMEHLVGMIVAIALITVGRIVTKKVANDVQKYKRLFVYFVIGLLILLIMIPWPFRAGIGRPWL
ncbi:MAG: hypothetical protein ACP5PS_06615, partial [Bacteroidales bacterium]